MERFLKSIVGCHNDNNNCFLLFDKKFYTISIYTHDINLQESQAEMKVKMEEMERKQDEIKVK